MEEEEGLFKWFILEAMVSKGLVEEGWGVEEYWGEEEDCWLVSKDFLGSMGKM